MYILIHRLLNKIIFKITLLFEHTSYVSVLDSDFEHSYKLFMNELLLVTIYDL